MSEDSSPNLPDDEQIDSRLAAFMRKAAPVITAERGLNAGSRLKLESLAKDMKLPKELFEEGLKRIQDAPPMITSSMNRWEKAFAKRLKGQLNNLKGGILTASMEKRAVRIAKEKYQLEEIQAREIIQQVVRESGIGRISVSEAERHLEELVREKVGTSSWVDPTNRDLIHQTGKKWGLGPERVETLIAYYIDTNRSRQLARKRISRLATIVTTIVVFLALGGLLAFVLSQSSIDDSSSADANDSSEAKDEGASTNEITYPSWWSEDHQINAVKARLAVEGIDPILTSMSSNDATARGSGYRQLAGLFASEFGNREPQERIKQLMVAVIENEPADTAYQALLDTLVTYAQPSNDDLPAERLEYEISFSITEMLARLTENEKVSEARREGIAAELTLITGTTPVNAYGADAIADRYLGGLSETSFRTLTSASATRPKQGLTRHEWLHPIAEKYLDPPRLIELDSEFLLTVIPFEPSEWDLFQEVLNPCLVADNPLLYRFVTLAETTPELVLQRHLFRSIGAVLDVPYQRSDPEQMASELRRKIGVVPGLREDENAIRWAKLRRRVDELAPVREVANAVDPPQADEIVLVSHYANMACALAQTPPRSGPFDRLVTEGQPVLSDERREGTASGGGIGLSTIVRSPSRSDRERMSRFIGRLTAWDRQTILSRVQALKGLQSIAEEFNDIPKEDADAIAQYLLANKEEAEHLEVLTTLPNVAKWNSLLLAVADQVEQTSLPDAQAEQIVTQLAGSSLFLAGPIDPRRRLRKQLLETVLDRSTSRNRKVSREDASYDRLQDVYLNQIMLRSSLLSRDGSIRTVDNASQAMEMVCMLLAERTAKRDSKTRPGIDSELVTIQFLTSNDLGRTVLLQRQTIQLLKELVIRESPSQRDAVEQLWDEFMQQDDQARHIATQLYLGEWYQLQMWMRLEP